MRLRRSSERKTHTPRWGGQVQRRYWPGPAGSPAMTWTEETDEHTGQFARRGAPMVDVSPGATTRAGEPDGRLRGGTAADGGAAFDL
jgi:hypothetical protein